MYRITIIHVFRFNLGFKIRNVFANVFINKYIFFLAKMYLMCVCVFFTTVNWLSYGKIQPLSVKKFDTVNQTCKYRKTSITLSASWKTSYLKKKTKWCTRIMFSFHVMCQQLVAYQIKPSLWSWNILCLRKQHFPVCCFKRSTGYSAVCDQLCNGMK